MNHNIMASFGFSKSCVTASRYRYDYGQQLVFKGIPLPDAYEVHFSNEESGQAKTMIGDADGVLIPDEYFLTGKTIYAWLFLHDEETDGRTMYKVKIPVINKAKPTDAEPTPVEQDLITQAIAALGIAVEKTETNVTHYPRIEDGTWRVWDSVNGNWVDTGIEAHGDKGDKGDQGVQGETGATPNLTIGTVETLEPTEDATATITGTAENPILNLGIPQGEVGEVSYADLKSLLPMDTASGAIVSIPDGQSIIPVESLKVALEPIQDLNGYDKPWSGGAGRNLLNVGGRVNQTAAGVRYTSDDNYIILNGTKNGVDYATMENLTLTLPAGTYYAKAFIVGGTLSTGNVSLYAYDGTSNISKSLIGSEQAITLESETTLQFRFGIWRDGNVLTNYTVGIVISKTSGIDKFYPYSNICPISGRTECDTYVSPTTFETDAEVYTTDLGRTVYGGTLDVLSGELVIDRAMVDLGTLDWSLHNGVNGRFTAIISPAAKPTGDYNIAADCICDRYVSITQNQLFAKYVGIAPQSLFGTTVFVYDSVYDSAADFKAAMNGAQFCYELAEPQTYQLRPTEVKLLLGNNTIWSDGEVIIIYSADVTKWIEKRVNA